MERIVFVLGIVLDWHQEWPPRVFSVSPIVRIRQWAPTNAVALSNSPKPWMSSFLRQPVPCSWETTTVPGNLDQRFRRSHSMFWLTNWQRRILYNTALWCYDAMQCADVFCLWTQYRLAHKGIWPHTSTQTHNRSHGRKVIRLCNSMFWSVLANPPVCRIRDTKLFSLLFSVHCEPQTLWNATLPWPFTHTLNAVEWGREYVSIWWCSKKSVCRYNQTVYML